MPSLNTVPWSTIIPVACFCVPVLAGVIYLADRHLFSKLRWNRKLREMKALADRRREMSLLQSSQPPDYAIPDKDFRGDWSKEGRRQS